MIITKEHEGKTFYCEHWKESVRESHTFTILEVGTKKFLWWTWEAEEDLYSYAARQGVLIHMHKAEVAMIMDKIPARTIEACLDWMAES